MLRRALGLVFALLGFGWQPAIAADAAFERDVLAALNAARTNPGEMANALLAYRDRFRGKHVEFPGNPIALVTQEGATPVDEAVRFLMDQRPLPPLAAAEDLADGAAEHVVDQGSRGFVSHVGTDGSTPLERMGRRGGRQSVAEVIQFGAAHPIEVIRQLIVDDGVANRAHRRILFDPTLRFAGVACGAHRDYGSMCVIDFAAASGGPPSAETDAPTRVAFQASR